MTDEEILEKLSKCLALTSCLIKGCLYVSLLYACRRNVLILVSLGHLGFLVYTAVVLNGQETEMEGIPSFSVDNCDLPACAF